MASSSSVRRAARRLLLSRGLEVVRTSGAPPSFRLHLEQLFDRLGIDVVLDVGAHVGEYGSWLRAIGFEGRIVSFEPVPESFAALAERTARDAAWRALPYALGAQRERRTITLAGAATFSSFRPASPYALAEFGAERVGGPTMAVDVRTLDEIWDTVVDGGERVYLKLDTQGWDLDVLRGTAGRLERVLALQTEVALKPVYSGAPSYRESLAALEDLGFEISGLFPVGLDSQMRLLEVDCVALRPAAVARGRP